MLQKALKSLLKTRYLKTESLRKGTENFNKDTQDIRIKYKF